MIRTAAFLLTIGLAIPASAEEKASPLPKNTINCAQFKKTGTNRWIEVGVAVFDLGDVRDIHLNDQPVAPGSFKFGGIDVYPVLEKKCGTPEKPAPETVAKASEPAAPEKTAKTAEPAAPETASKTAEPAAPEAAANAVEPATLAMAQAIPRASVEEEKSAADDARAAPAPEINQHAHAAKDKPAPAREGKCASGRSVYAADALAEKARVKSFIEIFFDNRMQGERNQDFLIREIRNNEIEWTYKGVMRSGRFVFTYAAPRLSYEFGRVMLSSTSPVRRITLEPVFIKPTRDGTGEAILHIQGLGALLASHRFKLEGKRPPKELPEHYYFDRCE